MIPRKLAKRLLEEYLDALCIAEDEKGVELDADGLRALAADLVATSDLVLRGSENVEQKARRYLAEGRLTVAEIRPDGTVVAHARGSGGETYALGYDAARRRWGCTCPVKGVRCSHIVALRLVVEPRP